MRKSSIINEKKGNNSGNDDFSYFKKISIIIVLTFLSKGLGVFRNSFIAYYYGVGNQSDAFKVASQIPMNLFELLFGAFIANFFIPFFSQNLVNNGKKKAFYFANNFINIFGVFSFGVMIFFMIFSRYFIQFFYNGFDRFTVDLTVKLLYCMLPIIFISVFIYSFVAVMQSFEKFYLSSILSVFPNIFIILYLVFFNDLFNVIGLSVSVTLGWVFELFILIICVYFLGYRYVFKINFKDNDIVNIKKLFIPTFIGTCALPISSLLFSFFASNIEGGVSVYDYANNIFLLLLI